MEASGRLRSADGPATGSRPASAANAGATNRMLKTYVVRYGQMRSLGEYTGLAGQEHPRGQRVVVRSDRGTELGEVLCPANDRTALFLKNPVRGEILRAATAEDLAAESSLAQLQKRGFAVCGEFIVKRRLQMD